jgi:putative ABC transport system substrate-binding protein
MKGNGLIMALLIGVLAVPPGVHAQQPGKVYRIGFLGASRAAIAAPLLDAFRQGLHELGYVEGRDFVMETRWAEGKLERLSALAAELVQLHVDVLLAGPPPPVVAARSTTNTIPIVFTAVGDPVEIGLVASLARPGGNLTGLAIISAELSGKRLQLLKEVVPRASRVAALWNPASSGQGLELRGAAAAARALNVELQPVEFRGYGDFEGAFQAAARGRAGALLVLQDTLTFSGRAQVVRLAAKHRLPAMYPSRESAEAGGLVTFGPNFQDNYRRAATFVDKILKGAKPGDLPVEQPTKFELVINLRTAKALGLTIPQSILIRADEVIQ